MASAIVLQRAPRRDENIPYQGPKNPRRRPHDLALATGQYVNWISLAS